MGKNLINLDQLKTSANMILNAVKDMRASSTVAGLAKVDNKSITSDMGVLTAHPVISDISGNAIEEKSDGLYAPDYTTEIEALKKSVSDGKTLVADAITEKGVETATNSTFQTMADNISLMSGSVEDLTKITINSIKDEVVTNEIDLSTLPELENGRVKGNAVLYNEEIHYLGGSNELTSHVKYNNVTNEWETVSEMPLGMIGGAVVSYNGKIYRFCGTSTGAYGGRNNRCFSWCKDEGWVELSVFPGGGRYFPMFCLVDNILYFNGGASYSNNNTMSTSEFYVYLMDNDTWQKLPNMPGARRLGIMWYDESIDAIHVFGGCDSNETFSNSHYVFDISSSTWSTDTACPVSLYCLIHPTFRKSEFVDLIHINSATVIP